MNTVLNVQHLTKRYPSTSPDSVGAGSGRSGYFMAVNDISFSVGEGEIVGLLGPNGAGKTTTISMIMSILTPTSGKITIFGKDLETHREEVLKDMNFSSAYTRAPWRMKIWEHLYVFATIYEIADAKTRINSLIETFELTKYKNELIGDLSAGNLAKLNLAKAYINNPKLLLLDEPTSSLDPDIAAHVREYILATHEKYKTAILFTSHNMAEIDELCDRVIFINNGRIVAEDTPERLAKIIDKTHVRLRMKDGQKRTIAYAKEHKLVIEVAERFVTLTVKEKEVSRLLSDLGELGVEYSEIAIDKPTLEDFFITQVRKGKADPETSSG